MPTIEQCLGCSCLIPAGKAVAVPGGAVNENHPHCLAKFGKASPPKRQPWGSRTPASSPRTGTTRPLTAWAALNQNG